MLHPASNWSTATAGLQSQNEPVLRMLVRAALRGDESRVEEDQGICRDAPTARSPSNRHPLKSAPCPQLSDPQMQAGRR